MIDPDFAGLAELERQVNREKDSVLRSFLSAADWDTIVRAKGIVFAYDRVLEMMQDIQRKMNEPQRRVG